MFSVQIIISLSLSGGTYEAPESIATFEVSSNPAGSSGQQLLTTHILRPVDYYGCT